MSQAFFEASPVVAAAGRFLRVFVAGVVDEMPAVSFFAGMGVVVGLLSGAVGARLAAALFLLLVFAAGCSAPQVPDYSAARMPPIERLPGSRDGVVTLRVRDARRIRDRGLLTALERAVQTSLEAHGFRVAEDGALLELAVEHFFRDQHGGFWSTSETAELIVRCRVGEGDGRVLLDKTFQGEAQIVEEWKPPLARLRAFEDLLEKVLGDREMIEVLESVAPKGSG